MSMRARPSNSSSSSSSSNSNSNNSSSSSNHMSAKRAGGGGASRRISESSLGSATTTSTSTSVNQSQQHAADKSSAVKRKKRRKDEEKAEVAAVVVVERVPVVLLTRLEDERKSNERKSKPMSDIKVVIERTDDIESIKVSSSDKLVPVGKKSTRHSVHRTSENLASSDAKTLEPIGGDKEKTVVVAEESVKAPPKKSIVVSSKNSDQTESKSSKVKIDQKPVDSSAKEKTVVVAEESVKAPPKKLIVVSSKNSDQTESKSSKVKIDQKPVDSSAKEKTVVMAEESVKAPPKKSIVVSSKNSDQTESRSSKVKIDQKPVDSSAEQRNVHNVNNDNDNLNKIDPKIIERQLLVRLDRLQVENFLEEKRLQRLQSKDELVVETNKNHSKSKTQDSDAPSKASKEIKTCAIPSDAGVADETEVHNNLVKQPSVDDVPNRVEEVQQNTEEPVEIEVKKKERYRKNKKEETAKSAVKNQRLSSREKRKVKSQDIAGTSNKDDSDKDLRDDTKINQVSSVQMNENQIEHLDKSSKDTFCESAKSNKVVRRRSLSKSKSLNKSAVADSEKKSSKKSKRDQVNNEIIESNSIDDNSVANDDSNIVTVAETVPLPMEVDAISHNHTVVDDSKSKAEDDSAQQICDVHSKNVIENAKSLTEGAEAAEESTKEILSESAQPLAENLVDSQSSESPIENLISSDDSECPAKNVEENGTSELPSTNVVAAETIELPTEKLVNGDATVSPTDSFASCENAESTNEGSISGENNELLIETIEDTESTSSTCTLIEETPEELTQNLDKDFETEEEGLSEDAVDKEPEVSNELAQDVHKETEAVQELPQVAEKEAVESPEDDAADSSLKADRIDESLSQEDKIAENNEHESTFEYNLKSVENLVIDSILNGEIVSPKIIAQSSISKVEEVQTFVFEGGVEDFVNDIEVPKEAAASLEPSTSTVESLEPAPFLEESPVAETLETSVSTEEPAHVEDAELAVAVEKPEETLPLEALPTVEPTAVEESSTSLTAVEESTTETTLESPPATEEATTNEIPTPIEEPIDEEFSKHRRKHTLSELKKKCTENIGKRQAEELEEARNSVDHEEPLPANIFTENHVVDGELQVAPSVVSTDCFLEQTVVTNEGYFENISDAESDICLSDRLSRLSSLKIPSFEDPSQTEKSVHSDDDESSRDHTKRQRILMKITKTDANKHVTHLVESKEEEAPSGEQPTAEQVTEGEIKIIMRKESSTNSHVIKEIKIIPRTPEGGNSARIPGYSPTSSDLSSGNSSCRVPSCSPAKPDSGSYRMPGWSPASTEMGQTMIKKKQGRPKKYPIFTDAELIAKTTAIVNNVDVHAIKHADKPLFEPVESIRINEEDEVENEEEHQTVITNQMYLSGDQLLDAMPVQPEILAKYAKEIQEGQALQKKKKKMGRPRKKPLNDFGAEATSKVTKNVTVAKIEFSIVDSIEEFVEPVKNSNPNEILLEHVIPAKKKMGRPRKKSLQDDNALLEKSTVDDFSVTEDETVDEDSDDKPYSERIGLKPTKHLNEDSQLSKNQIAEETDATTEDEGKSYRGIFDQLTKMHEARKRNRAIVENVKFFNKFAPVSQSNEIKPRVERRGRKPWKHLKNVGSLSAEEDNSMTEPEDVNDSLFTKPKVERRGRKPWKHLKNVGTLSAEEDNSMAKNDINDSLSTKPKVERRGRKPWKHLKNIGTSQSLENSMTETDDISDSLSTKPKVERRGRKPWKHLKNAVASADSQAPATEERPSNEHLNNDSTLSENQVAEKETLTTENEGTSDASVIKRKVERRGRKPWKHLKNIIALQVGEAPIAQEQHLNDDSALSENQVTEEETSMTENESMSDATSNEQQVKKSKSWKHSIAVPEVEKRKKGRPRKINVTASLENQVVEKTSLAIEAEAVHDTSSGEPIVNNQEGQSQPLQDSDTPSSENVAAKEAVVQDESVNNADEIVTNCEGQQSLELVQDSNSVPVDPVVRETTLTIESEITNDTAVTEVIVKKKRDRTSLKNLQDNSEANSMTEDESADDTLEEPAAVEEQQPSNHSNDERTLFENPITENENSTTENWDTDDASVIKPKEKKKRGRKPWKHLIDKTSLPVIDVPVKEKKKRGRKPKNFLNTSALLENQAVEEANAIVEDKSGNDISTIESIPENRVNNVIVEEVSSVAEDKAINKSPAEEPLVEKKSTNAQTEDETVSSTEDIPPVDRVVQKKRVRFSTNVMEDSSSLTEDETVSSTEDIPKVDQPVVKRKPGRPRMKNLQTNGVPRVPSFGSPVVKRRGRPPKNPLLLANSLLLAAPVDTTEDETVSSTEDIPTVEQHDAQKNGISYLPSTEEEMSESLAASSVENLFNFEMISPKKRGRTRLPRQDDSTFDGENSSIAASSMEDLSPVGLIKKRGRKPRVFHDDSTYSDSLAASSMEDLSSVVPPVGSKKGGRKPRIKILSTMAIKRGRGRPPKSLSRIKITLQKNQITDETRQNLVVADMTAESIEEFSPVKQLSPVKKHKHYPRISEDDNGTPNLLEQVATTLYKSTLANNQSAYDRSVTSLSPVKKKGRGRPPKYPRKEMDAVDTEESHSDNLSTTERSPNLEKRRGRPPSRLSQDENILPSIINYDVSENDARKPGCSPRRLSHDSGVLPTSVFLYNQQQSEGDDLPAIPSLGKRQGRPPRKFSPGEEHSFSALPHPNHDSDSSSTHVKRQGRSPRKYSYDDGVLLSQSSISDSDEAITVKRKGRPPKKFHPEDSSDASLVKRKPRRLRIPHEDNLPPPPPPPPPPPSQSSINDSESTNDSANKKGPILANLLQTDRMPSVPASLLPPQPQPLPSISDNNDAKLPTPPKKPSQDGVTTTMSTTNLLRQQRKPKMSQPQQAQVYVLAPAPPPPPPPPPVVAPAVTNNVIQPEAVPPVSPVKKRGRQAKLSIFEVAMAQSKRYEPRLPGNMTTEQLRQRRHSQDDSMFSEDLPKFFKERSKEFEDAQSKRKRGRPKVRELLEPFVAKPSKSAVETTTQAIGTDDNSVIKEAPKNRMGRSRKVSHEKVAAVVAEPAEERTSELTAADYLRTWTDRDESPGSQAMKKSHQRRRFSQDDSAFGLGGSRPSSRNRLRRYSQGDTLDGSSDDDLLTTRRKRTRSSGSDDSLIQDEKRPRVEKELCTQHSITKELVVQLTKIDKPDEPPAAPAEPIREIVKMSLRRKLESNSNAGPPPLVPIEPRIQPATHSEPRIQPATHIEPRIQPATHIEPRIQPATHSDAKLLMLMQPPDEKMLLQPQPQPQHLQPPPQQFCIIFIPDALTSSESSLCKDSQPTATIVNFQPVPDSELANKSVIYTPTTPSKIYVNEEQHNRSFLCNTCTQALDLVGRMEANVGMTEEDKSAIKCPFCSNDFQSLFYLEYHLRQEHLKCENEKQCRHSGFNTLRIPSHDASSESEIYITFALKCRSCYELFENVLTLNEHVKIKHANLIRHKPPLSQFSTTGMVCYPPPPFKNGVRPDVLHCPSDCICRIGIRSTDSPMQRAQVLKRCPNFMRRLEKIEAAAYEVYTCTLCKSTFLMKDEVVEHLMKMHEVSCKFPCTKCLTSFRAVQMQENHHCSETTIRDLDKLINIVILPTDKAHDNSKFEDSSNDELGPMKTTPPPAVPSASSTPLNGVKRKNGVVIQRLSKYLAMQPPKKAKLDAPTTPVTAKKRLKKTPCPKCQKKFAYRKSLNDHIIFEHIIPCKADEASKNMAVELLRLVNNGGSDVAKIEELASALGKYTDDDGVSLTKLTMINDEQENWNDAQRDAHDKDLLQCFKCKANFKLPANSANLARRNNQQSADSPAPQLCERCDPTRRRRNVVNNGHIAKSSTNGEQEIQQQQQQVRYTYECDRCGDSFATTIELNRHKNDEHSNKPSEALKCDICSKAFYTSRMLDKHKKMQHEDSLSNSRIEDNENMECNNQSVGDVSKDSEANDTANSSTSRRDSSDNNKEEEKCKCPHCDFSAEKVSLKNHLKREHGVMAFICQFCGKLLVEISEVRHMLDYHIKSSRKNGNLEKSQDDVSDLLKTLGKKRLQSLMIYHDFEGKCNNAIMRCSICLEQFATRESCRHHYQWMHDAVCILCDATFTGGNVAGQHKIAVHNSIASYVWAIQRLVSAIVHSLRLDRAHPSNVLYQEVSMRLDMLEEESNTVPEGELPIARMNNAKSGTEEAVSEPFLEPVVLSEDQLPGSGNMIEVVIGNDMVVEDSEDNLLEDFYLSPNYESSCEQPKILDTGAPIPELEEEEEVVASTVAMVAATTTCATVAVPTTPSITTSNGGILIPTAPVTAENYATSAVFKLRQDNGQEEVVLAITDEDLVTHRDDIGSLAERLSATCDSLSLEEITTMLRSYFENVGTPQTEEVELANAIEPRTQ